MPPSALVKLVKVLDLRSGLLDEIKVAQWPHGWLEHDGAFPGPKIGTCGTWLAGVWIKLKNGSRSKARISGRKFTCPENHFRRSSRAHPLPVYHGGGEGSRFQYK
jgi:hypothetical protein